jgi:hypothetical protein
MEREVWLRIVTLVDRLAKGVSRRYRFDDARIALVLQWAALHDRPVSWACRADHWPAELRPARLPTPATMTRRLRSASVVRLLRAVERCSRGHIRGSLLHIVDGKPLPVAKHSRDRQAGFGRGVGGLAKGYKLHVITSQNGELVTWCVRSLQQDEAKTAADLLTQTRITGYLLADRNYDRNALYAVCRQRDVQLLAPRRYGPQCGLGRQRHDPARLYAVAQQEHSLTGFAPQLMGERRRVERWFGSLSSSPFGLTHLPPWVRGLRRVERWVTAKLTVWHCAKRARRHAG